MLGFNFWEMLLMAIVFVSVNSLIKRYVKSKSKLLDKLFTINNRYIFNEIDDPHLISERHDKKYKYDRDTPEKLLYRELFEKRQYYEELLKKSKQNRVFALEYKSEVDGLYLLYKKKEVRKMIFPFSVYEKKLFVKFSHSPVTEVDFQYELLYTSPKGRNSYEKRDYYDESCIILSIKKVEEDIHNRNTRQYIIKKERSKMTNTLRYKILNRDNNRCQVCGSTQSDGVKLQVDHIIPVSKGGKTEENNLQTLCDRCNSGKSDKVY